MIFDATHRTSFGKANANESQFAFLNRSATKYFGEVRRLLEEWLSHVPDAHQPDLISRFRSDTTAQFESAFWELYLHEAFMRSGAKIVIHPHIAGSPNRPDFFIQLADHSFYLEAVRLGAPPSSLGAQRRLADVEAGLDSLPADQFMMHFTWNAIGPNSLGTKNPKGKLIEWVDNLDHSALMRAEQSDTSLRPQLEWKIDGWDLTSSAFPVNSRRRIGGLLAFAGQAAPGV